MNCDVIRDLLPLFVDDCCSVQSTQLVTAHLTDCPDCRSIYERMRHKATPTPGVYGASAFQRISHWKASVLQSVLLFLSFGIITVGVALEAGTPTGLMNGFWAFSLVIPATGFLLSLANWYFVRLYKSRRAFSNASLFATLGITLGAYIWAFCHYEIRFSEIIALFSHGNFLEILQAVLLMNSIGILLSAAFCVLSKVLSNQYARLLGRE